jgi:hypothetical protein
MPGEGGRARSTCHHLLGYGFLGGVLSTLIPFGQSLIKKCQRHSRWLIIQIQTIYSHLSKRIYVISPSVEGRLFCRLGRVGSCLERSSAVSSSSWRTVCCGDHEATPADHGAEPALRNRAASTESCHTASTDSCLLRM